ncbi:MAG: 5'-deoxynucleotidase [Eubacteriales bacterium]|nr:5'-deoxynucleotidase [Eubacteriales bacterium]
MYNFYAYLYRMKYINRWGLMRNTETENIKEHSFDVACLTHALCLLSEEPVDTEKAVLMALYHDLTETITGDLATPVKYFDPEIRTAYKRVERIAADKLLEQLPPETAERYRPLIAEQDGPEARLVKAADKLSAYIKCATELKAGNTEFSAAAEATLAAVRALRCQAADLFCEKYLESYLLSLDELKQTGVK